MVALAIIARMYSDASAVESKYGSVNALLEFAETYSSEL